MGITSAMNTGLSGLTANQDMLSVVGNNIANVNTIGYKASTIDFKTQLAQSYSEGTQPNASSGGTNPEQIGLGVSESAISKNYTDGSLQTTGVTSDLAIEGGGFFIVNGSGNTPVYTRDGSFTLNSLNQLVDSNGNRVQGFGTDSNNNIVSGTLKDVEIPLGTLTEAAATTSATIDGSLNSNGTVATTASVNTIDQSFYLKGASAVDPTNPPTSSTLATDLADASNNSYFQVGDVLTSAPTEGGRTQASKTLTISSTTTLGDIESFLGGAAGINTTSGINGTAATPGVTAAATGNSVALTITGNVGEDNDLSYGATALSIQRGSATLAPFTFTKSATANGESAYTTMTAYDSLGSPVEVDVTMSLIGRNASGTQWQYLAQSPDGTATDAATNLSVGQGTLSFDNYGTLQTPTSTTAITIDRDGSGALPVVSITPTFSGISATSGATSQIAVSLQNGAATGTLSSYSIGDTGVIIGSFSNGQTQTLGQIALATFRNNEGLIDNGGSTFTAGPNSGDAVVSAPEALSAGKVVSGALEDSNVDLSNEFVVMIAASTGYSANSRIITTGNQLLQELLSAAR
jgi:flagellar hook protein FlgE